MSGRVGHRLSRAIVHGRAESAGRDDHLGSFHGCVNSRDDILPFITDDRFESNCDPELAEFVGKKERVGIRSAPDQSVQCRCDSFCGESAEAADALDMISREQSGLVDLRQNLWRSSTLLQSPDRQ